MKTKKSQIRMTETIAVLIVFMFLMFVGYSFYASIQQRNYQSQLRDLKEKEAVQIALKVYYLPELHCSFGTRLENEGCIDGLKFDQLKSLITSDNEIKDFYQRIFGNSRIKLIHVYPRPSSELTLFDSEYDQNIKDFSTKLTQMPVAMYDPIHRRYAFGYLQIEYFYSGIRKP